MFHRYSNQFLAYCQLADFSTRSIQALSIRLQALSIRLNEFESYLKSLKIRHSKESWPRGPGFGLPLEVPIYMGPITLL